MLGRALRRMATAAAPKGAPRSAAATAHHIRSSWRGLAHALASSGVRAAAGTGAAAATTRAYAWGVRAAAVHTSALRRAAGSGSGGAGAAPRKRRSLLKRLMLVGAVTFVGSIALSDNPQYRFMRLMPMRALSRAWGAANDVTLPTFMRAPLYRLWLRVFNGNESEVQLPLESYPNLGQFFIRYLKDGSRSLHADALVSPVDGKITVFGEVSPTGTVEQVKGVSYPLNSFLGFTPTQKRLHYCVLYLAPGDYHRIHSPTDCTLTTRRHFSGELYPVLPSIAKHVPGLFALNERIVLTGRWPYGFFSLSPVGAYNVGSIALTHEPELRTNTSAQRPQLDSFSRTYADVNVKKGEELARFQLGSTVVLVFEVADGQRLEWTVAENQTIRLGQSLARVVPAPLAPAAAAPAPAPAPGKPATTGTAFQM